MENKMKQMKNFRKEMNYLQYVVTRLWENYVSEDEFFSKNPLIERVKSDCNGHTIRYKNLEMTIDERHTVGVLKTFVIEGKVSCNETSYLPDWTVEAAFKTAETREAKKQFKELLELLQKEYFSVEDFLDNAFVRKVDQETGLTVSYKDIVTNLEIFCCPEGGVKLHQTGEVRFYGLNGKFVRNLTASEIKSVKAKF